MNNSLPRPIKVGDIIQALSSGVRLKVAKIDAFRIGHIQYVWYEAPHANVKDPMHCLPKVYCHEDGTPIHLCRSVFNHIEHRKNQVIFDDLASQFYGI